MDWLLLGILYLITVLVLTIEANNRVVGKTGIFLISLFCTPLIGLVVFMLSPRKINFYHFVKLKNHNFDDKHLKKTIHKNVKDKWVEIKSSELRPY